MSRRSTRPTSYGLSFGSEDDGAAVTLARGPEHTTRPSSSAMKRKVPVSIGTELQGKKRTRTSDQPSERRQKGPPGPKPTYLPTPKDELEDAKTIVYGEDPHERLDIRRDGDKPIRALNNFSVFDPRGFEMIPLGLLDENTTSGHHFEAAGVVSPVFTNEEDESQEDGLDSEDSGKQLQRLRTSAIFRYHIDYTDAKSPLYIETQHSWFLLRAAETQYRAIHRRWYCAHRIAQIVISAALDDIGMSYARFLEDFEGVWDDLLGEHLQEQFLYESVSVIQTIISELEDDHKHSALTSPIVHRLLQGQLKLHQTPAVHPRPVRQRTRPRLNLVSSTGSLDLAVLRPENQNPTHVTPHIDNIAQGLFEEHIQVVGPPPKAPPPLSSKRRRDAMHLAIAKLANRENDNNIQLEFPRNQRLHDQYWKCVVVDHTRYTLGDCVVMRAQDYRSCKQAPLPDNLEDFPEDAVIADYFWFAKIIYIDQKKETLHVHWYEHAKKTVIGEVSDPRELFFWPTCDDVDVRNVVGKATVYQDPMPDKVFGPLEYFCGGSVYNETEGTLTDLDQKAISSANTLPPPENCPCCVLQQGDAAQKECRIADGGLFCNGHTYHMEDYVLYHAPSGPAGVGRIMEIHLPRATRAAGSASFTIQLLGRVSNILASQVLKKESKRCIHEQELFFTDQTLKLDAQDTISPCLVLHPGHVSDLGAWLEQSPVHFFAKRHFPSMESSWSQCRLLRQDDMIFCTRCVREDSEGHSRVASLLRASQACLSAFDPFAGVGAFALAMEQEGLLKLTHAVEIAPSAALTLKKNSPHTIVYNQCSNLVFKYAVKSHAGNLGGEDIVTNLGDNSPLPKPPLPGEIDCIITGLPCQPHSQLNMFQRANDRKSHLILNLLSWVDFLRPKYCFFENVRGYLSLNLHARQAGRHRVEGGIKMGGLKFLIRALVSMKYQVRFGLLQAGHYGTPQSRIRFFLIASQQSYPLPLLPQPTHDFPHKDSLQIKFPNGTTIQPIVTENGIAPFKFVSVAEAIGDLPEFDWEDPHVLIPPALGTTQQREPTLPCEGEHCGYEGPAVKYRFPEPRTTFQQKCRRRPTSDLQHFTSVLPPETVERVVNVPLRPGADYRDFQTKLWEWQTSNPASAVGRDGFPRGMYGRLDGGSWFHTTVTKVLPTAKQSYVVHPWCKRILTIRELARSQGFPDWFVFHAVDGNVKTLQRHIGNAVPWQVSQALARELRIARLKWWEQSREDAIVVE
ncbi:S-adenosyl-L-methionine-dependent methyltransferase [Trametes elegans]|nr:S-adenosyl-L-methionine-dependent methyltransferase [Trametes elegans]